MIQLTMQDILFVTLIWLAISVSWSIGMPRWNARLDAKRRLMAAEVLKKHNLTNHLYCAGVGIEDGELKTAVTFFRDRGHIVVDAGGQIVGAMAAVQGSFLSSAPALQIESKTVPLFKKLTLVD
jgi:hypothetical protein